MQCQCRLMDCNRLFSGVDAEDGEGRECEGTRVDGNWLRFVFTSAVNLILCEHNTVYV